MFLNFSQIKMLLRIYLFFQIIFVVCAYMPESGSRRFCGPALTQSLSMLCGKYKTIKDKRAQEALQFDMDNSSELEPYSYGLYNLGKTADMGIRMRRSHTYVGAVSECCYQPCSIRTLMTFCG